MKLKRGERLPLLLFLFSVICGGWATTGLAAESPLTPIADSLLNSVADRISAVTLSQTPEAALATPARPQIPVGEIDGDDQHGRVPMGVPGVTMSGSIHNASNLALDAVGKLGPAGMLPAAESRTLSPTEFASEASALFGSPQQGVMTLDRGYRDAMPGGPASDHP